MRRQALAILCAACIVLSAVGNFAWVALNTEDDFSGYDHDCLSSLLYAYDHWRGVDDPAAMRGHGDPETWLYLLGAASARVFGLHNMALALAPFLGWALALVFGFLLAKDLAAGQASAGWLAASFLAWSPFLFGPTRRFCPWSLAIGAFLACLWGARRFQKRPTWANAALFGLLAALGARAPHDPTTQALFLLSAATPFVFIVIGLLAAKTLSPVAALGRAAVAAGLVALGVALAPGKTGAWLVGYVSTEADRFSQARGFWTTLFGYVSDAWFNTLQPAGLWLFAGLTAVFWKRSREWRSRLWAAAPLALLLALSLIPKKNTWYTLEALAFFPVLAGAAFALVLRPASRRVALLLAAVAQAALAGQYAYATFISPRAAPPRLARAVEGGYPIAPRLDRSNPNVYRAAARRFLDYAARRGAGERLVDLGLATDGGKGVNLLPYYLRQGDSALRVHLALAPDAPELGAGLDGVLFVPSRVPPLHQASVLELEALFHHTYVAPLAAKLRTRAPDEARWRELTARRIAAWRAAQTVDLGGETLLFLPSSP